MRVITWNVNSVKARLPRVLELLAAYEPDVVCVQETKVASAAFPRNVIGDAGYEVFEHSEGRWNGVALLVPSGQVVTDIVCGLPGEPTSAEARWLEATIGATRVVSVYVPNGREPTHPMFATKLGFLAAARKRVGALIGDGPLVVAGDFNVAPTDDDVWDISAFDGATHVTPEERAGLFGLLEEGLVDAYRVAEPDAPGFTWWDYRMGAFRRGMGMRIDLVLVSEEFTVETVAIDTIFRRNNAAGDKPSDHAPVVADLATVASPAHRGRRAQP